MRGSLTAVLATFALLAAVYGIGRASSPVPPVQGDGYYTWLWARSLAFDGDLDLENDYATCGDPWSLAEQGAGSLPANQWTIGPALLWTPLAAVGRLLYPHANGCRGPVARFAMAGTVIAALLALALGYRMATRVVPRGPALVATLGVGLASSLAYYTIYLPSYSHVPTAFAVALFLERWDATRGDRRPLRWLLLGVLLALAMLMRPQLGLLALAPLVEWLGAFFGDLRRRDGRGAARMTLLGVLFVLAAAIDFAPQLALNRAMYGSAFALPQGPGFMRWLEPNVTGTLFGTTGGLLFWTPFLYLSVIGFVLTVLRRETRTLGWALLLVFAATVYVNASVWDWWGSMGFSNRRFTALAAPFVVGAAVTLAPPFRWAERHPRGTTAAFATFLVLVFAAWNFAAMAGVSRGRIKSWREQPADLAWEGVFDELASSVVEHVGNPLSWPASIPFALRYHVHPKHWDAMQGMRVFYVNYEDLAPRVGEESVRFDEPLHREYLVEGFEARRVDHEWAAVSTGARGRMLVPLFLGAVQGVEVRWRAVDADHPVRVVLTWNGEAVAQADVRPGAYQQLRIAVPDRLTRTGINDLVFRTKGGSVAIARIDMLPAAWLPPGRRFGEKALTDRRTRPDRSSDGSRRSRRSGRRSTR